MASPSGTTTGVVWSARCWPRRVWGTSSSQNALRDILQRACRRTKTHDVHVVRASPVEMGFPIRRRRTFTIGINRETMIWTGPIDPAKVQQDFEAFFTRTVEMSGDCFFCAKGQDIETFLCERVALRKTILPSTYKTSSCMCCWQGVRWKGS